jgi:hypothetical protein
MELHEFKIGHHVYLNGEIAEILSVNDREKTILVKKGEQSIWCSMEDVSPVYINDPFAIKECGFDQYGLLFIKTGMYHFYFQLYDNYIILLDEYYKPLIHFWDVVYLHQFKNLCASLMHTNQ